MTASVDMAQQPCEHLSLHSCCGQACIQTSRLPGHEALPRRYNAQQRIEAGNTHIVCSAWNSHKDHLLCGAGICLTPLAPSQGSVQCLVRAQDKGRETAVLSQWPGASMSEPKQTHHPLHLPLGPTGNSGNNKFWSLTTWFKGQSEVWFWDITIIWNK